MKQFFFITAAAVIAFSSCKKNNGSPYNSNIKADLSIEFDNIAGSSDLELNTGTYTNNSGENFTVTKLKYYVSNFVFTNVIGTVYTVSQDSCYFLIDEANEDTHEPVLHVPEGEYKTLSFIVGVDSLRSTMSAGERTGVLDPTGEGAGMYWDLNSGYIFFKMEGTSPASPLPGNYFAYHIGGYGGYNTGTFNNIKTLTFDLAQRGKPQVKAGKETNIHLMIDVIKMFSGTNTISIAAHPEVMFDTYSATIAGNFVDMFRHDHTEN
jgi:hypothetical protein